MPYTYKTLAQAQTDLAARLFDPSMVFWSAAELTAYLQESISTFNAYANYWREEFVFQSVINTVWYDFTSPSVAPNTIRPRPVFSTAYLNVIEPALQYHLLEPVTNPWSGTTQFSESVVAAAVQRASDQSVLNSGAYVKRTLTPAVAGRTSLADTVMDIRRVAWIPNTGFGYTNTPLFTDDQYASESYDIGYTTAAPGIPMTYAQSNQPQLAFDVDRVPAVPGFYEVLASESVVLSTADAATRSPLTSDWLWVIKYGVMADLLSRESQAKDPLRAQYCNARFKQGLAALSHSPSIMLARLNDIPLAIDSVQNKDNYNPNWQGVAAGTPDTLVVSGQNLVGLARTPDAVYGITLSVVRNAVLPSAAGDYIPVNRGDYEAIVDYAHHLASFKMGGADFMATIPQFVRFVQQCAVYNSKLLQMGEFSDVMLSMSGLQEQSNPRLNRDGVLEEQAQGAEQ